MHKIKELEDSICRLKALVKRHESMLKQLRENFEKNNENPEEVIDDESCKILTNDEIARYSRQIILPEIGVKGQLKLKSKSFFVVGAGGLGCPALQYLVAAGAGRIGICDYDNVEINNLHRQILHTETNIGAWKTFSARKELMVLNSNVNIIIYNTPLCNENVLELISSFDIVIDCSDNVATRYLMNDACYLSGKPLVSGSALKFEGQLTVYNYKSGPCYRCIFPIPPPPEAVANCGDAGILGAVTGVIGSLQALEAIKIALDMNDILNGRLLIFDGITTTFRNVRLRDKRKNCELCSDKPIITHLINYEQFCGTRASDKNYSLKVLDNNERITVKVYNQLISDNVKHLLIDVRSPVEYEICRLENSINIPIKKILEDNTAIQYISENVKDEKIPVFLLCRRGNDSQLAVRHLKEKLKDIEFKDIIGGLHAWHTHIDDSFPIY